MISCSVIIPVYNVETYLAECLDSVINQSIRDIEIICVDDGSTDNSLAVLNTYKALDDRITIVSQNNHGASSARNTGLDHASGNYIYFLDSDDYLISNTALEVLIQRMDSDSLDFLAFGAEIYYESAELESSYPTYKTLYNRDYSCDQIVTGKELLLHLLINREAFVQPCLYLAKHSLIKQYRIRFVENIIYEDELFFWAILLNAKRASCLSDKFYCRRIRANSVMTAEKLNALHFLSDWRVYNDKASMIKSLEDDFSKYILSQDLIRPIKRLKKTWQKISERADYEQIMIILSKLSPSEQIQISLLGINILFTSNNYLAYFPFSKIPAQSKIVLYGAGDIGKMYFSQIISSRYCKLSAWADIKHNFTKAKASILISPTDITDYEYDYILIALDSSDIASEIRLSLSNQGISNEKILWYPIEYRYYLPNGKD